MKSPTPRVGRAEEMKMRSYPLMGIALLVIAVMFAVGTASLKLEANGITLGLCFTAGACFIADAIIVSRK